MVNVMKCLSRFHTKRSFTLNNKRFADRSVRISTDVRASIDRTGLTILHIGRGRLFKGNSSSADIWIKLTEQQSPASIAAALSRQYQVTSAQMEQHVVGFVTQLQALGLVLSHEGEQA
jgi:hypothetical protein